MYSRVELNNVQGLFNATKDLEIKQLVYKILRT